MRLSCCVWCGSHHAAKDMHTRSIRYPYPCGHFCHHLCGRSIRGCTSSPHPLPSFTHCMAYLLALHLLQLPLCHTRAGFRVTLVPRDSLTSHCPGCKLRGRPKPACGRSCLASRSSETVQLATDVPIPRVRSSVRTAELMVPGPDQPRLAAVSPHRSSGVH